MLLLFNGFSLFHLSAFPSFTFFCLLNQVEPLLYGLFKCPLPSEIELSCHSVYVDAVHKHYQTLATITLIAAALAPRPEDGTVSNPGLQVL